MTRIIGWILLLLAFSTGVLWLTDHPGSVEIVWLGYEIRIQVAILFALMFLVCLILLPLVYFLRYLLGIPSLLRNQNKETRQKKGLNALTHALTALAISDTDTAERNTQKAAQYLGEGPLTALLSAQIAYRKDDMGGTQKHLKEMLSYEETKFIAARALSAFARTEGNYPAAISFARDALRFDPRSLWAHRTLLDLYLREQRWQEAEGMIKHGRAKRRISVQQAQHMLALYYHMQAQHALREENTDAALRAAQEAHKHASGFIPASLLLIRLLGEKGERRKALAALTRGFKASPHPEYGDALLDLCQDEPASKLTKRAKDIASAHPVHPESQLLQARVAMHLGLWDVARNHIKLALTQSESSRPYRLLAAIETKQYDNRQSAAEWLARAAEARPDATWTCSSCGHQHKQWQLNCMHCDSFDALEWSTPKEHFDSRPASFLLEQM